MYKNPKNRFFYMLPGDIFIIVCVLLVSAAIFAVFTVNGISTENKKTAVIYADNTIYKKADLNQSGSLVINHNGAEMTLEITDSGIRVLNSSCANQHCVKTGRIDKQNQIIACIPNHIYITIESEYNESSFDAVIG